MASGQRPGAEVDAQLVDLAVVLAVADDRDRKFDSPRLTVEVQDHLPKAVSFGNDMRDILDRDVAASYPGVRLRDERLERARALDASSHELVQFGLGGERPDQRVRLPDHQAVEVGDRTTTRDQTWRTSHLVWEQFEFGLS